MTIGEAASLVIQAGALAKGGEVYLLDMGNSIRIKELAEKMIRLSGNAVAGKTQTDGIKIIYTGLRPGEKIYEELLLSNAFIETDHEGIKKGIEKKYSYKEVSDLKDNLMMQLKKGDNLEIKSVISTYVEGFSS
jgi:FlaA1/EpsC-like NDP-sugar epimerase